jgi:L-ascorbate metabolism protein UlaG (beta-lactamase superfamily)
MTDRSDADPKKNTTLSRRTLLSGAAGAGALAAGLAAGTKPAAAQSAAWMQPGNNNHILDLQSSADAASTGEVTIDYYGHCAFRITSPGGLSIMFDPWRNDPSGAWGLWYPNEFPKTVVDVCMSTHTHFDHDAIFRPEATMVLDRMVGSWSFGDVSITGIADKHACEAPGWYQWTNALAEFGQNACPPDNPGHMDMVMYVVETGGIRTLIWGDNRHNPPEEVWQALGRIDVLTLPVDGSEHILSYEMGNAIVERLKPKIVIPTHYLNEATTLTLSTLARADEWVESQKSFTKLDKATLELAADGIAGMNQEFQYFGSNVLNA